MIVKISDEIEFGPCYENQSWEPFTFHEMIYNVLVKW